MTTPPSSKTHASSGTAASESFPPLMGRYVHTLVLGTMPGQKSLQLQQYYAHPRNALWPIMCALATNRIPSYAVHQDLSYEQRCKLITTAGFALWDVLASCERPGSLDSDIVRHSELANPIPQLIIRHPELRIVACNGRTAEALFKRHILPQLVDPMPIIVNLPSTSPAMATLTLQEKFERWRSELSIHAPPLDC